MDAAPPPPPPQPDEPIEDEVGEDTAVISRARLAKLKETRARARAAHRKTVEQASYVADVAATPSTPLKLPLPTTVRLGPADDKKTTVVREVFREEDMDDARDTRALRRQQVSDGFAALRAQRAQRKQALNDLRKTSQACSEATNQITPGNGANPPPPPPPLAQEA